MEKKLKIGFITISDRASARIYEDESGPAIEKWIKNAVVTPYEVVKKVIADEQETISNTIVDMCDKQKCNLVLTTGGTGPTKRDITPEATKKVCQRIYDGFAEQMRLVSLRTVPTAILSRQIAGTRDNTLIINLPGNPISIAVCLSAVFLAVPKCLFLLDKTIIEIDKDFISKEVAKTYS